MNGNEKELAIYYCEDVTTFSLDEFFQIFRDLCTNVNKILEVVLQSLFKFFYNFEIFLGK